MKLLIAILTLAPLFAHAGGTEIVGGVPGRVLVQCSATLADGTEVYARVQPILGKGLTLRVIEGNQTTVWSKVHDDNSDPRGLIYFGKGARLLIPNVQGPDREPGHFAAQLKVKGAGILLMDCQR